MKKAVNSKQESFLTTLERSYIVFTLVAIAVAVKPMGNIEKSRLVNSKTSWKFKQTFAKPTRDGVVSVLFCKLSRSPVKIHEVKRS